MKYFIISTLIIFVYLIFISSIFAQNTPLNNQSRYLEIIRKEGWELYNVNILKIDRSKEISIAQVKVQEDKLKLKSEIATKLETFFHSENNGLQINSRPVYIYQVYAFSLNSKRFAYRVFFTPKIIENGLRIRVSATITVYFYDEDGDGKFETRYQEMKNPKLPKWFLNKTY